MLMTSSVRKVNRSSHVLSVPSMAPVSASVNPPWFWRLVSILLISDIENVVNELDIANG